MITIDEIYENLKQTFESESGFVINDGGDMALRFYAVAAEMVSLWAECDFVHRQSFPQTATGEYLERHAQMRGIERDTAAKAHGSLRFEITAARSRDVYIQKGVRCMTSSGVEYVTCADAFIRAGQLCCDVPAEAVCAGKMGNASAEEVNIMQNAPVGIKSVINPMPFTGGRDDESDDELRARIIRSYGSVPNGGNIAYYEKLALGVEGVAAVKVLPRERGRGTVDIIVAADSGTPSQTLLDKVSEIMNVRREICVDVDVLAPTTKSVDVTAAIKVKPGYTPSAVLQNVRSAVAGYFGGKGLGKNVLRAELGKLIYSVAGVENYGITAPASDVSVAASELPVLRTLSISEA